jgi:hypothetical protein
MHVLSMFVWYKTIHDTSVAYLRASTVMKGHYVAATAGLLDAI